MTSFITTLGRRTCQHRFESGHPRPTQRNDPLGPSLATALSPLLPGRVETALLRTLLHRGDSARAAWQAFCDAVPDLASAFRLDSGAWRRLSPLLVVALRESAIEADKLLLTVLRTAHVREELRSHTYRAITGPVLSALRRAGVRFLVLRGAALGETVYRSPVHRHAHDVDLLVAAADVGHAVEVMTRAGLAAARSLGDDRGTVFAHRSGLPFVLHRRLHRLSYYRADFDALWERAVATRIADIDVHVPAHVDHLLHVLGHASSASSRATLQWVPDAWMLVHAPGRMEWATLAARVAESRLELPVYTMLMYLGRELDTGAPSVVLDEIAVLAARARGARRDIALLGAQQRSVDTTSLTPPAGWRTRLTLLRWRTFPSPEFMRWRYRPPRPARPLLMLYLQRIADYTLRRVGGVMRRQPTRV